MPKFYGAIGYAEEQETRPGFWSEVLRERNYTGDVLRNTRRWETGEHLNDNLKINNMISIVADPYAYANFHKMRYIQWMGTLWKITNIEVSRPRLNCTIGGEYIRDTRDGPDSASAASREVCRDSGYPGP